jgi:hypothetical protein
MSILKTKSLPIAALAEKGLVDLFNEASLGMDDVAAGRTKEARVALQALKQRLPQRPLPSDGAPG